MILSAQTIRMRRGIIDPFEPRTIHEKSGMSYGLSACGYDIRIRETIKIPPHGFALASSLERFDMPHDLVGSVRDKSSWARKGLAVQNTVIEPGWRGYLTLELTNHREWSISVMEGSPIAQVIFERLDEETLLPYEGKYQDQPARPVEAIFQKAST